MRRSGPLSTRLKQVFLRTYLTRASLALTAGRVALRPPSMLSFVLTKTLVAPVGPPSRCKRAYRLTTVSCTTVECAKLLDLPMMATLNDPTWVFA